MLHIKTMSKKFYLLLALALAASAFALWCVNKKTTAPVIAEPTKTTSGTGTDLLKNEPRFVTDVDPDVNHWQTKETKYMKFKFPKEWYWLELTKETGGHGVYVISNNPDFPLEENSEIGIFSDIGPDVPIILTNPTEIVITDRGTPTSNSGAPLDSLESIIRLAKYNYPEVECVRPTNLTTLPLVAHCSATYHDNQHQVSYYVIDESWSLTITARSTDDSLVLKDILEKIARNIKIKY